MPGMEQYIGLRAAPDTVNRGRLAGLMRRYARDMDGTGVPAVMGYDAGDAAHSFSGPVALVPSPTKAINATVDNRKGIYRPTAEFQNGVSQNPGLDPYSRTLWARMNGTIA